MSLTSSLAGRNLENAFAWPLANPAPDFYANQYQTLVDGDTSLGVLGIAAGVLILLRR